MTIEKGSLIHTGMAVLALAGLSVQSIHAQTRTEPNSPREVTLAQQGASQPKMTVQQETPNTRYALERRISVDFDRILLSDALEEIAKRSNLVLSFKREVLPVNRIVDLQVKNARVIDVLEQLLKGTGIVVERSEAGRVNLVPGTRSTQTSQATGSVTGRATDSATQKGIPNVTVTIQGTRLSVTTNDRGDFTLRNVPPGEHTLQLKLLGYTSASRTVQVEEGKPTTVQVVMRATATSLSEVVTTATGTQRRVEVANQVTKLNVEEIMKTAPIMTVTDLLVGRVPGLVATKASGSPGDPTRLRLRGVGSITQNNDPIVIVDGVRMYNDISNRRNANSTLKAINAPTDDYNVQPVAAPSPLDQIDPNSIETVEVFNGPSATSMYGSDAAAGVIVITTKRGKAGPTRWTLQAGQGTSSLRTSYQDRYVRMGRNRADNSWVRCMIIDVRCIGDTLIVFNAARDGDLSPVGRGSTRDANVQISGGTDALRYNVSGGYSNELGILKLPGRAGEQYQQAQGDAPPGWMRRPERFSRKMGAVRLSWMLRPELTLAYTGDLSQTHQTKSSLSGSVVTDVSMTYANPEYDEYSLLNSMQWQYSPLGLQPTTVYLPDFYRQSWDDQQQLRQSMSSVWQPWSTLRLEGDVGVSVGNKEDHGVLRSGFVKRGPLAIDTAGYVHVVNGRTTVTTANLRTAMPSVARIGVRLTPMFGLNYVRTSMADVDTKGRGLTPGTATMTGAREFSAADSRSSKATFGTYLQTQINLWDQLFLSPAVRFDGGSTFGDGVNLFTMPKLGLSWLLSEASFFPKSRALDELRLRVAYGQSGQQPGPVDRLRTYQPQTIWYNNVSYPAYMIASYGNTQLRPERSTEMELGFDATVFDGRIMTGITWYNKMTRDALLPVEIAPSVLGGATGTLNGVMTALPKPIINLGRVRNSGIEFTLDVTPIRTPFMNWTSSAVYSHNRNVLRKLNADAAFVNAQESDVRYVEGYPLAGRWNRPMVSYADVNGNNVIDPSEIQYSDSLMFQGGPLPRYEATWQNTVTLFNGQVSASAQLTYKNRQTQVDDLMRRTAYTSLALNDPTTPLATQAVYSAMLLGPVDARNYAVTQTVSTLRFNSMSVSYLLPRSVMSRFRTTMARVSLQGNNLGIRSNYTGLDPNMNVLVNEIDGARDIGGLPVPRSWRLALDLTF